LTWFFVCGPLSWDLYAAFHGMIQLCHIEGSMITAVWTHLRMFLNSKLYHFMFECWILLKLVLGSWTVVCTWQFRPLTGSIKPTMQHFKFWCVGLYLGILIFFILSSVFHKKPLGQDWSCLLGGIVFPCMHGVKTLPKRSRLKFNKLGLDTYWHICLDTS
jgi:hypothetical protein